MDLSKRVAPTRSVKLAEADCNTWRHRAPHGTTLEDVMRESYWVHNVREMKDFDEIKVVAEDGSFYAWLLVTSVTSVSAFVTPIHVTKLDTVIAVVPKEGYRVEWGGPAQKHRIIRNLDNALIDKGFPTKEAAQERLAEITGEAVTA